MQHSIAIILCIVSSFSIFLLTIVSTFFSARHNLNIPRYVDTFEPEEQIDLKQAIADFQNALKAESTAEKELNEWLKRIDNLQ